MQQVAAEQKIALELRRVSEPIIHQLNIVPAARGVSLVSSFFAPYLCEDCDREQGLLLDVRVHGAALARMRPPPMNCEDCRRPMGFAHPPSSTSRSSPRLGGNAERRAVRGVPSTATSRAQPIDRSW